MRFVFALLLLLVPAPAVAETLDVPAQPIVDGAIERYLRPGFDAFAAEAGKFRVSVEALCAAPADAALVAAQDQFRTTALAYAQVEFARIGPLGVGDRAERLLFWPDPKGIALRQVQAALASSDASVTDPASLASKSVAMQGLVAAEYLLFGTGNESLAARTPDSSFRCAYLHAIARLVLGLAGDIDHEWQDETPAGPAAALRDPRPDAATYRSSTEVVQQLTQVLGVGNETIRDQRVLPILGAAEGAPRPKSALFWRSGLAARMLAADFSGLQALYQAATLPDALGKSGAASTADSIAFEFDTGRKAAGLVGDSIEAATADPDRLRYLKELVYVTRSLDTLLGQNLPDALGLTNGFSLLDGD